MTIARVVVRENKCFSFKQFPREGRCPLWDQRTARALGKDRFIVGFFDRTLIRGLLLAGGTALLVGVVGEFSARALLEDADLRACQERTTQVVAILGADLLEPSTLSAGRATHHALERLLYHDRRLHSLYTILRRSGRDVVVLSVSRERIVHREGAPVELSEEGHRAFRTGKLTAAASDRTTVYVPINATAGDVLGLLVAEIQPEGTVAANLWMLLLLPLLAAGAMGVFLYLQLSRPLQKIQSVFVDHDPDYLPPESIAQAATALVGLTARMNDDVRVLEAQVRANAQQMKRASDTRDEVISNTVHELRTPLSTIVATLEILQSFDDLPKEEADEFLAQATAACQHMRFLVNDILDSAAIESGMFAVDAENCSLNEILRAAERVMQPSALANSIELRVLPGDPDIMVHADQSRVLQVLFNLLSNAIKYSPMGRTVTVRATSNPLAAVIEVIDEGEGVPLASRARLFSKFTRLAHNHKHVVEGSGIGLYLSKQLVEIMNGSIGYRERNEEEDGETGSVFWFTLPLAKEEPADLEEPAEAALEETLDESF